MWFVVASALLVLVYVVLKPLCDGLTDTSACAAKVMLAVKPRDRPKKHTSAAKAGGDSAG
jgi:hypothetical protein